MSRHFRCQCDLIDMQSEPDREFIWRARTILVSSVSGGCITSINALKCLGRRIPSRKQSYCTELLAVVQEAINRVIWQSSLRHEICEIHTKSVAVERQKRNMPLFPSMQNKASIAASILGIPMRSVYHCLKTQSPIYEIQMGRPRNFDDFDKKGMCLILSYHTRSFPELPALDKIHSQALLLPGFPVCSRTTMRRWKSLGFVAERGTRKWLWQDDIVAQWHRGLQALVDFRAQRFKMFYQDETCVGMWTFVNNWFCFCFVHVSSSLWHPCGYRQWAFPRTIVLCHNELISLNDLARLVFTVAKTSRASSVVEIQYTVKRLLRCDEHK